MSQLVACHTKDAMIIAADRRVEVGDEHGGTRVFELTKLFQLGPRAVVATSGAGVGIEISHELAKAFETRAPMPLMDLEEFVIGTFQKKYGEFIERGASWFAKNPEAHRLSYILLAGYEPDMRRRFVFYASEEHKQPYRPLPVADILAAPRRIGLETRLLQASMRGASTEEMKALIYDGLALIESKEHAVAGPFDIAVFDNDGLRTESVEST